MKRVIALRGRGNVGKSTTIRKAYAILTSKYPNACVNEIHGSDGTADICVILTHDGIKIGIESQGDPSYRLPESLKRFVGEGCLIILCATRTWGGTVDAVEALESYGYELCWMEQRIVAEEEQRESSNAKTAGDIVAKVKEAMDSVTQMIECATGGGNG